MQTPQQVADNWARGMGQSTDKIKAGIQAVTEAPTKKAAARQDAYLAGVQNAVSSGKFANALNAVTLEQWKTAALDKGVNRIAGGAQAAKQDFASFMQDFLPYVAQGVASLPARGDTETNINRAVSMMRWNAKFRRK